MTDRSWVIGADPACDLVADRPTVSSRHCRLTQTLDGFLLEDLQSSNGTFVNGNRIAGPVPVSRNDVITLGRNVPMPWPDVAETDGGESITIGRRPENDVVLDYPMVSGFHARITTSGAQHWIEDLGSTNGTAIGSLDNKIAHAPLAEDDAVFFGSLRIPASRLLSHHFSLGYQPYTAVKVERHEIVLGRLSSCDIVLDDPQISHRHGRVVRVGDQITVEDLGSTNGTFVNGQRIKGKVRVVPGDVISLGTYTFTVEPDGNLQQRNWHGNVAIEAQAVSVAVPNNRLLDEISLTVYPSEFVGVMGPSGAGKTTLMMALNGYMQPSSGTVTFNGLDLYANYSQYQGTIGYVPQDDIMHRDLTVGQALYYTARLRLPSDYFEVEIQKRVREVMEKLGLEGTENVLIGSPQKKGISGGQRKRVNLAMELLTDPSVLFLDEPTSGLSSEDALVVMRLLRKLADDGKTILLTIHQPSVEAYRQLDNLILVGKDQGTVEPGRLVYYGPAYPQAVEFFNPDGTPDLRPGVEPSPDEVLRGLSKKRTAEWAGSYAASPLKRQFVTDRAGKQPVAEAAKEVQSADRHFGFTQWWTLVRRCLSIKIKDTANTAILLAQAPIIAVLTVLVFGKHASAEVTAENWPAVAGAVSTTVFLLALAALWFGCSNSARGIVGEWAIYHRERMVNLKIPSYVGSKFAVLGALCLVQCVVLLTVVYWGTGMKGPWIATFALLLLTSLVGLGIGLLVSSVARTSEVAIALLPLILLPMVILAGVMQPIHKMNRAVGLLAQVMPSRWAFEGLLLVEIDDRPTWTPPSPPTLPGPMGSANGPSGAPIATTTSVQPADLPVTKGATDANRKDPESIEPKGPKEQDMAEKFFPNEGERMGVRASVIALTSMLIGLVVAIHLVLRYRDVH